VRARDMGLDGAVPKIAKRCCCQVRTCAASMEALVIANVAPVAVFAGCVRQPLKVANGHHHVLGSLVGKLCRAKGVLGSSWRGAAAEVGLLSAVAKHRFPGCLATNTSHAICVWFLCGPLNSRVGSAIELATVVFVGWVAWCRACNVRKVDTSVQGEARFNCKL
jgi:hypothetical protein